MSDAPAMCGIDELRSASAALYNCTESFLRGGEKPFTVGQLLTIRRAWVACDLDIYPDQWAPRQVARALRGIVPTFEAGVHGPKPTYPKDAPRVKVSR